MISDYAKDESRDRLADRETEDNAVIVCLKRDTHNDQGYHAHSSNYQNKSMPTERGLSVQWRSRLFFLLLLVLTYLTCRRFKHSDEQCNNDRLSLD